VAPGPDGAGADAASEPPPRPEEKYSALPPHLALFTGPLFVNGVSPTDVKQGQTGDCFFIGALAAVAAARPDLIERMVRKESDGTYTVHFNPPLSIYGPMGSAADVKVDGRLWANPDGTPTYAQGGDASDPGKMELWGPIIEKAYAEWTSSKFGYGALDRGGFFQPLTEITGAPLEEVDYTAGAGADGVRPEDIQALRAKHPRLTERDALLSLRKENAWAALRRYEAAKQPAALVFTPDLTFGTQFYWDHSPAHAKAREGLVPDHVYSFLGTEEEGGKRYVKLRNPWGQGEPGHDGTDDGIFRIDLDVLAPCIKAYAAAKT
jgi:hypothetical protein